MRLLMLFALIVAVEYAETNKISLHELLIEILNFKKKIFQINLCTSVGFSLQLQLAMD